MSAADTPQTFGTKRTLATEVVGTRTYHSAVAWNTIRLRLYALLAIMAGMGAYLLGVNAPGSVVVGALAPAVLTAAPRFVLGALRGATSASLTERPAAGLSEMSGTDFEDYVARIARRCGVPVIMTPLTGDWGVDLIVGRRPDRLAIQCKRQSRPVGAGAVQEVVAGAPMQDCIQTMVVTNHDFTQAARTLAELHGCVLVGGAELSQLGRTIRRIL